jgi:uncharacterized integral membrane protein
MSVQEVTTTPSAPEAVPKGEPAASTLETRGARFGRKARRTRYNVLAFVAIAVLVCLVALVVANTRQVELNWVIGSSNASLVWIVLFSAILGWLLGIVSGALFRWRTRAPRA